MALVFNFLKESLVFPHHRSHPILLSQPTPTLTIGLDLILTPLAAAVIYPLRSLPSILSEIPKLVEHLQHRYDSLYIIFTIPFDREVDVWTSLVKSSVGKLRRAIAIQGLNLDTEDGLEVKVGWVPEKQIGSLIRFLIHRSAVTSSGVSCLGGSWLGAKENEEDEDDWDEVRPELRTEHLPGRLSLMRLV